MRTKPTPKQLGMVGHLTPRENRIKGIVDHAARIHARITAKSKDMRPRLKKATA